MGNRVLGIEVSGDADEWRAERESSAVWIALGELDEGRIRLDELKPVQALAGEGAPFDRLVALLGRTDGVAALSAPFSLPRGLAASALLLWSDAGRLRKGERPFGQARDLLVLYRAEEAESRWRACEMFWRERGVALASALTTGAQGAAAAALATMTLLQRHDGPVWPQRAGGEGAILVEASPAAQLAAWGVEPGAYASAKPTGQAHRRAMLEMLTTDHGLLISPAQRATAESDPHALNAILCLWAARVIAEGRHPKRLPKAAHSEGWIVVDAPAAAQGSTPLVGAAAETEIQGLFARLQTAVAKSGGSR